MEKMNNVSQVTTEHIREQLGPGYKHLAAIEERDNVIRVCDTVVVFVLIISVLVSGGLVAYRLWAVIASDGFRRNGQRRQYSS